MFFNLLYPLSDSIGIFNVFQYLTFRTGAAVLTALLISFAFGPPLIRLLRARQVYGQPIRSDGPESHAAKAGTPTMGGVIILLAVTVSTLLWADMTNPLIWALLVVTIGFGAIGFTDDAMKLLKRSHRGLNIRIKVAAELVLAVGAVFWVTMIL